jgi:glyoxylase-like metal-dependent hydrolase (beta-lactamase superfamily II)
MSLTFDALTPHLWSAKCRGLAMNTGIIHAGEHGTLIDPALFPDEIDDIAAFCDTRGVRVETVILTHHHWDHVLGAARFVPARIVAQQSYIAQTALELDHTRRSIERYCGSSLRASHARPDCRTHYVAYGRGLARPALPYARACP